MNEMSIQFLSRIENEPFVRTSVIAFLMPLNPSVEEIMEIKTMIAEAVTNAIIHGYNQEEDKIIDLQVSYTKEKEISFVIQDYGCGIEDVELAMQPLYTTKQHLERSGMGMTIMNTFADSFQVISKKGEGCRIEIKKSLHEQVCNVHQ